MDKREYEREYWRKNADKLNARRRGLRRKRARDRAAARALRGPQRRQRGNPNYWKEYRAENRDRIREQQRARRAANPEKFVEQARVQRRRTYVRQQANNRMLKNLQRDFFLVVPELPPDADAKQEEALAMLEGRDPAVARHEHNTKEYIWKTMTAPMPENDYSTVLMAPPLRI